MDENDKDLVPQEKHIENQRSTNAFLNEDPRRTRRFGISTRPASLFSATPLSVGSAQNFAG